MKTRLLKKIRKRYNWCYDDIKDVWRIRDNIHMDIMNVSQTTHDAVDYLSSGLISLQKKSKWYNKIHRLYY